MIFECHITVPTEFADLATEAGKPDWKTSEIARDPLLGDKNFFYLTAHGTDYVALFMRMQAMTAVLAECGVPVLREKIELIMYDTKQKPPVYEDKERPRIIGAIARAPERDRPQD